jgi:hypothetical protein
MRGYANLGNTCYFNSALQCVLQITDGGVEPSDCEFVQEYRKVVAGSDNTKLLHMFQTRFSQFTPGYPHDVQEAVLCLLDALENVTQPSIYFDMVQETVCRSGKTIRNVKTSVVTVSPSSANLLDPLLKWMTISDFQDTFGNTWAVAATRTQFWTPPKTLIVSLTLKTILNVEETIDLKPYIHANSCESATYSLFATSAHLGGNGSGHYIAFIKKDGDWYFLNDDHMEKLVELPRLCGYYILFYNRNVQSA